MLENAVRVTLVVDVQVGSAEYRDRLRSGDPAALQETEEGLFESLTTFDSFYKAENLRILEMKDVKE